MKNTLSAALALTLVAGGWILAGTFHPARASANPLALEPISHPKYDPAKIDREIAFHEGRVKRDPTGAIGWQMLSGAYLARSRESDSDDFAWKAEEAARRSLELRETNNQAAHEKLVQSLLEQHRFQDALVEARRAAERFPWEIPARCTLADCLVEVGQLDQALTELDKVKSDKQDNTYAVRAHIASLRGDHATSIRLYRAAQAAMAKSSATPEPTLAWFTTKVGTEQELMHNDRAAESSYREALSKYPKSYKTWLGMARIATRRHDWNAVLDACAHEREIAPSIEEVAMRGDAYKAMGMEAAAQSAYGEVRTMWLAEVERFDRLGKGGPLHVKPADRQFVTFALSHHMFLGDAKVAARRDAENRPDAVAQANLQELDRS